MLDQRCQERSGAAEEGPHQNPGDLEELALGRRQLGTKDACATALDILSTLQGF
jgi:hypothetical protein